MKTAASCEVDFVSQSITSQRWHYGGEGGANIIITFPDLNLVLRFPKTANPTDSQSASQSKLPASANGEGCCHYCNEPTPFGCTVKLDGNDEREAVMRRVRRIAEFGSCLMSTLFGQWCLADLCRPVQVSPADVDYLEQQLAPLRPAARRCHRLNRAGLALLMPDATRLSRDMKIVRTLNAQIEPIIAIELKPKQGFVTTKCQSMCTFCQKQFFKLKTRNISLCSRYCPLDLFSGSFRRFLRAVRALVDSPQNNFRVFLNGVCCRGFADGSYLKDSMLLDSLSAIFDQQTVMNRDRLFVVIAELLFCSLHIPEVDVLHMQKLTAEHEENGVAPAVVTGCMAGSGPRKGSLLNKVLEVQQMCEPGAEAVAAICQRLMANASTATRLHRVYCASFAEPCWLRVVQQPPIWPADPVDHDIMQLQRYCLGASVRDCSIMVCLQRERQEQLASLHSPSTARRHRIVDRCGRSWCFVARVIDTDPKPLNSSVSHWRKQQLADSMCQQHLATLQHSRPNDQSD